MKKETVTIKSLLEIIEQLTTQNKLLEQKVDYLTRQIFAKKSEKLPNGQLSLFADLENKDVQEEKEEEKIEITYIRAKGGKKRPPADLPRVRVEHDIADEEKICSCGCQKKLIREVITEQ